MEAETRLKFLYYKYLSWQHFLSFNIFKDYIFYLFRERGREEEREGKKHQCVVAHHMSPTGDLAHNPCALTGN